MFQGKPNAIKKLSANNRPSSRHFHDVCFKAHGRLILNCLPTKGLPDCYNIHYSPYILGAASKENSFYREGVAYAQGCVTPVKNLAAESGTSFTQWSPLEAVTKPAKVYRGKDGWCNQ
ncbi:hypothetical protein HUJ05_000192 [Dendroctonus ponderosae]|nr:hypothetical protein HUJ05_000192 [Dendroctonus ponderosae]